MPPQLLQHSLDDLISREAIFTVLQPIVKVSNFQPLGHEALTRGESGHLLQRADLMFRVAQQVERSAELERLCLRSSVNHFARSRIGGVLFLNVSPVCVLSRAEEVADLTDHLLSMGVQPANVVLEISERFPIDDLPQFSALIGQLKELGYGIAIDDLGSGYSGLKLWSHVRPDYVKIDRHFIERIDEDTVKQAFVTSVVQLCEQLNCEVIAEGIERVAELKVIRSLGIQLGQGYLLGRPAVTPKVTVPPDQPSDHTHSSRNTLEQPVGTLCQPMMSITPEVTLREADEHFRQQPQLMSLPVTSGNRPVGLLHRRKVQETFSLPYGRALHERKTVQQMMQQDPLIVDKRTSLEAVSNIMTGAEDNYLRQHFIISDDGEYCGIVNTIDLLKRITDAQIQTARYANPLTLLPGNVPIDEHIERLLAEQRGFNLMYVDLDFFKPFNDHYGYRQGDAVLRWLGRLLHSECQQGSFVGHVGGDDFIVVSEQTDYHQQCQRLLQRFAEGVEQFYSADDLQRGCITSSDRSGRECAFSLLCVSIGIVPSYLLQGTQQARELASLAAEAKKQAKLIPGSAYFCLDSHPTWPGISTATTTATTTSTATAQPETGL
ncbi:diguanylate cyclase [Bacterioplanes sanyensis]|uniref:Diguanylate cyclase n=1 Tax=Bacterioplanes sanyensis TaxID=1249553 RepID=A0A222FIA5_9GAMM|nr:GGDEF domain-containing protein [Bacterioplanes sanyensis]ASP38489.1 diguanylate cyclase [Bacterioplanes sanyensis]